MPEWGTRGAAPPTPEVVLSFDPGSDPVTGRVSGLRGDERSFVGWTELFCLLDAAARQQNPG
jgi:hypothetical protein